MPLLTWVLPVNIRFEQFTCIIGDENDGFFLFSEFILFHCKFNMIVSTFSIKPRTPGFEGVEHFPPSVWITSTPSRCRSSASLPCSSSTSQETIAFEYKRIGLKMLFSECILSEDFSQIKIF